MSTEEAWRMTRPPLCIRGGTTHVRIEWTVTVAVLRKRGGKARSNMGRLLPNVEASCGIRIRATRDKKFK